MEEKTPAANVIVVMTLGMDARKQAIFRMAFKMYTVQRYQLIEDAVGSSPDIAIIDMDSVGANTLWKEFRDKHPKLPAVAVTVSPEDEAPAPIVTKPIRMETLFPLLRQVLSGQVVQAPRQAAPAPVRNVAKTPASEKVPDSVGADAAKASIAPSVAKKADVAKPVEAVATVPVAPAVTRVPDVAPANAGATSKPQVQLLPETIERFDPRLGLLGALREIRRLHVPSLVSIAGEDAIVALPGQDSVLLRQDMAAIRRACDTPSIAIAVRQLTPQDSPPRAAASYSFTGLLWQTALWTSRGRLMEGILADTPIRLRHWPNLTRLAPTPQAMRIAALWVRFPINLRLTVRMLNVEPGIVFDFLAASHSIGILDVRESVADVVALAPQPPATAEEKERGGLLSRLLRKVVRL